MSATQRAEIGRAWADAERRTSSRVFIGKWFGRLGRHLFEIARITEDLDLPWARATYRAAMWFWDCETTYIVSTRGAIARPGRQ